MKKIIYLFVVNTFLFFYSCTNVRETPLNSPIYIKGNLEELPNGIINIVDVNRNIVSSTNVLNGKFEFKLNSKKFPEPVLVSIEHFDSLKNKRIFSFQTNSLPNGKISGVNQFMLEDGILINGKLIECFQAPNKTKVVFPDKIIITGKQTKVFFENFSNRIVDYKYLSKKINEFPFSFYFLFELEEVMHSLSNEQVKELLDDFDKDVQASKTGKIIQNYIEKRVGGKLNFETVSIDLNGENQKILNQESNLNMIILWASWCGPCRQEIPELKSIYKEYSNNKLLNMVSLSIDEEPDNWKKALNQEKMPWKQLLVSKELSTYSKEFFDYNGSIPTVLLVDRKGKIVKKIVGYDKSNIVEFRKIINQYVSL